MVTRYPATAFRPRACKPPVRGACSKDAEVAVARTPRAHPVFCPCRVSLLNHLAEFLAGGGRRGRQLVRVVAVVEVSFDDQPEAFHNFNTLEELRASDQRRVS